MDCTDEKEATTTYCDDTQQGAHEGARPRHYCSYQKEESTKQPDKEEEKIGCGDHIEG